MTRNTVRRWQQASEIAIAALGKEKCTEDPLAYWCLVELIYNYGNRKQQNQTTI